MDLIYKGKALILCQLDKEFEQRLANDPNIILGKTVNECIAEGIDIFIDTVVIRSGVEVNSEFLDLLPNLHQIIRAGSGLDGIDLDELERRRIKIYRNPYISAKAVAELALGALIMLVRRIPEAEALLMQGCWEKPNLVGDSLSELTVAIWGAGPVGQACFRALTPFSGQIYFTAWSNLPPSAPTMSSKQLVRIADAHVFCLPLRSNTRMICNSELLDEMRFRRPYLGGCPRI